MKTLGIAHINIMRKYVADGFDTVVVGMISPKRKGCALIDDQYRVAQIFPLKYKDKLEQLVNEIKESECKQK
jgi:hypothetical protein